MQDWMHPMCRLSSCCYLSSQWKKQLSRDGAKAECSTILDTMSLILPPHPPGAPLDPTFLFQCITANIICSIVFGERFDYTDRQFLRLLELFYRTFSLLSSFSSQVRGWEEKSIHSRGTQEAALWMQEGESEGWKKDKEAETRSRGRDGK